MKRYCVQRVESDFEVDGALAKPVWDGAARAGIDQYPWRQPADPAPPLAEARLLYSRETLYVRFHAWERSLVARAVEYQSQVCADSCVEFFVSTGGADYLNFETNCIGTLLLFRCGPHRQFSPIAAGKVGGIRIATSLPKGRAIAGPEPGPAEGYVVEYSIPFAFFQEQTGCPVPQSGTVWRCNFYKCCDQGPEPAWGTWSPVGTPRPDFHRPEYFGELVFA
jgi:hypothetical protein